MTENIDLKRLYQEFDKFMSLNDEVTIEMYRSWIKYAYRTGRMGK